MRTIVSIVAHCHLLGVVHRCSGHQHRALFICQSQPLLAYMLLKPQCPKTLACSLLKSLCLLPAGPEFQANYDTRCYKCIQLAAEDAVHMHAQGSKAGELPAIPQGR